MRRTYTCGKCGAREEVDQFNNLIENHWDKNGHAMMPQFQFADLGDWHNQQIPTDPTLDAAIKAIQNQGDNFKE